MSRAKWFPAVGLVLAVSILGCGSNNGINTVPAKGTVTLDGKAIEGATVTFAPADTKGGERAAVGTTDASGNFTLNTMGGGAGAVPGKYAVMISKVEGQAASSGPAPASQEESMKRIQEQMAKGGAKSLIPSSKVTHIVPPMYGSSTTSGLTAEVKASGDNNFPFALKGAGPGR